jgi:hypothetical protein
LVFCAAALVLSVVVAVASFPFAALSRADLEASRTVVSAEALPDVDLGDFGEVSVLDLVTYYTESPPEAPLAGKPAAVRFQGC